MNKLILVKELMRMSKSDLQKLCKYFGIAVTKQKRGYYRKNEIVGNLVGGSLFGKKGNFGTTGSIVDNEKHIYTILPKYLTNVVPLRLSNKAVAVLGTGFSECNVIWTGAAGVEPDIYKYKYYIKDNETPYSKMKEHQLKAPRLIDKHTIEFLFIHDEVPIRIITEEVINKSQFPLGTDQKGYITWTIPIPKTEWIPKPTFHDKFKSVENTKFYNNSNPANFVRFLENNISQFKNVNFIASHGGFIRNLVHYLEEYRLRPARTSTGHRTQGGGVGWPVLGATAEQILADSKTKKNNLFIVHFVYVGGMGTSYHFYIIRHCTRIFQAQGGQEYARLVTPSPPRQWARTKKVQYGERNTPDPPCFYDEYNGTIQNELFFTNVIGKILEHHGGRMLPDLISEHPPADTSNSPPQAFTVGLYSSCMTRAKQTAEITLNAILKYTLRHGLVVNGTRLSSSTESTRIKIFQLPFIKEKPNPLDRVGMDVLNNCQFNSKEDVRVRNTNWIEGQQSAWGKTGSAYGTVKSQTNPAVEVPSPLMQAYKESTIALSM